MSQLQDVLEHCLQDRRITADEVVAVRQQIEQDGKLDLDDIKFLVRLLTESNEVCPEFDDLFFPVLKEVVLEDGQIGQDEQFYLLKMLYSDGNVRPAEKQFLVELRQEASEISPDFDALFDTALATAGTEWELGGR